MVEDINPFSNFFTESLTTDISVTEINKEQLYDKLKTHLSLVLKTTFENIPQKQNFVTVSSGNRLNFACPYCGDSSTNPDKKRGNLYLGNLNFKCYNCSTFKSIPSFLSDHKIIDNFSESELYFLRNLNITDNQGSVSFKDSSDMSIFLSGIEDLAIPRREIMSALRLKEINDNRFIRDYLKERKQPESVYHKMAFDNWNEILYFFNLTKSGKVIGLQGRKQNPTKRNPRFLTKEYSRIVTDILRLPEISEDLKPRIDKMSMVYNICTVNFSKDIWIFEGSIDANHIDNSIATWSASNKIWLDNGKYFYDNSTLSSEIAGLNAAKTALDKGKQTFLWKKFIDKYPKFKLCKDLNDIIKLEENFPISEFNKFFGNSVMDYLYIK